MQIKLIFTRKVVHLASVWKWRFLELGSGLLSYHLMNTQHVSTKLWSALVDFFYSWKDCKYIHSRIWFDHFFAYFRNFLMCEELRTMYNKIININNDKGMNGNITVFICTPTWRLRPRFSQLNVLEYNSVSLNPNRWTGDNRISHFV